jgi:aminoglycoside 6'-N-acetyltransferase
VTVDERAASPDRARRAEAAIRKVLLAEWAPAGVKEIPEAQDESDGYVGRLAALLLRRAPYLDVFNCLWRVETVEMGFPMNRERTEGVARKLVALSEELGRPSRPGTTSQLQTARLLLRPPVGADLESLCRILAEPEVAARWPDYDRERVRTELVEADPDEVTVLVIESGGTVIGAIQYGEEADPQYRHASIDILLGRESWGQGFGPEAIRAVASHLFEQRGHHRLTTDPAEDNVRAVRAYEKVGFRRVGLLRDYERGADRRWHDGVLMELLPRDLR